jgi:hypothetical protein
MTKARIHKYTLWQIFFFAMVFVVQNISQVAVVFPLMTLLCIPARLYFFPRMFEGWELLLLDGEDEKIKEWVEAKNEHSVKTARAVDVESPLLSEKEVDIPIESEKA